MKLNSRTTGRLLKTKITQHEARIGIIGLGYVGLPLVLEFSKAGFPVCGFDVDSNKVQSLHSGKSYIKHISAERIQDMVNT
ncbi:MAG: NAD(P)-binding domain-containing protein, partial [Pseudomonadota bacterium]